MSASHRPGLRGVPAVPTIALATVCAGGGAWASPVETFGLFPSDQGRAGASVAAGEMASAAITNPAAAARGRRAEGALGWQYHHLGLTLQSAPAELMDVHGTAAGVGVPFTFGPLHLGVCAAVYVPDQFLARIQLSPATSARYVMFDNRVHRTVLNLGVSVAIIRGVYLGVGATILTGVAGDGVSFHVGAAPGRTVAEGSLDASLPLRAAPVAGLLFEPTPWLTVGVRAAGAIALDVALDVTANASIPGTAVDGDAVISVRGTDHYTPAEITAGARVSLGPRVRLDAELAWRRWSAAPAPASDVALLVRIGASPSTVSLTLGPAGFRDIAVPRVAVEADFPTAWGPVTVRGGYAYVPTPVPAQTGATAWADGDRHMVTAGLAVPLGRTLGADWRAEISAGWQHMVAFSSQRREPLAPGGDVSGSGEILGGAAAMRAAW